MANEYYIDEFGQVVRTNHQGSNNNQSSSSGCIFTFFLAIVGAVLFALYINYGNTQLSVNPSNIEIPHSGGNYDVTISANKDWSYSCSDFWMKVSRSGNRLSIAIPKNVDSGSRNGYITINSKNKSETIHLTQFGKPAVNLSVSSTSLSFESTGGTKSITIQSNTDWNISVKPASWVRLTRNGNTLTLSVGKNVSKEKRSDYFIIKAEDKTVKVTITQSGSWNLVVPDLNTSNSDLVSAWFTRIWVDHNVYDSYGNKGMRIHVKFDVNGMLNKRGQAAAYFYFENGNALKDYNNNYRTGDGHVAHHTDFTPNYKNCTYNDLTIFMPYDELHISGSASCYFTISIWNGNKEIATSSKQYFSYSSN